LLNQISEFEKNYTASNALSWYTRNSFLYRIINKALRTQNMIYIFKCRFFIIDLFQQLKKSYIELLKLQNSIQQVLHQMWFFLLLVMERDDHFLNPFSSKLNLI